MLAYLTLEGPQSRRTLAELFWNDSKAKGNLSVVLTQFKKEGASGVVPDQPGLDPLQSLVQCDAVEFNQAISVGDLKGALGLYGGPFLDDLGKSLSDLEVSDELLDWVLVKREWFAQQAQTAMLALAERASEDGDTESARSLAEGAYSLPGAPELEPVGLARLQRLLFGTHSRLSKGLERTFKASLDDLPIVTRTVFLALSQQTKTNLSSVRNAFELTLAQISEARENLFMAGLVDAEARVLTPEYASGWFETHPGERSPLLLALARATPPEDAFDLYQGIYRDTQGFGGLGDLPRARKAFCAHARTSMDRLEFAKVHGLMEQVQNVERSMNAEPEPESSFLHAYALERLGRFREALEVVQRLGQERHDPNISALRSVLLSRTGKGAEAVKLAEAALKSDVDWTWAKATAYNTLGYVSSLSGDFAAAASYFKKSAGFYEIAGDRHRWIGALNNQATELNKMAGNAEKLKEPDAVIESFLTGAETAYHAALHGLMQLEIKNRPLEGRILFNLGRIHETRHNWAEALGLYERAESALRDVQILDLLAMLNLNLGVVYRKTGQIFKAEQSFQEAIQKAALTGQPLVQAIAMNNLAVLNNDIDQLEVSLELFEQSGSLDDARTALVDYRNILRMHFEQARQKNDSRWIHRILERLRSLHQRFGNDQLATEIDWVIASLEGASPASLEFDSQNLFRDLDFEAMTKAT